MSIAFFLEMAWKSALIAGAALMLVSLLRSRSAPERAAVLRIGVAMLLLLPLIALGLPALEVEAWRAEALPVSYMPPAELLTYEPGEASSVTAQSTIWDDPTVLFAILYAGGLLMAALRLVAGLWTLQRWTASAGPVETPEWVAAFARVRKAMPIRRPVRLLVSDELSSPLSWGWARPVIVVDRDTLRMAEDAEAILAHEWAHVVRQDWPVLMLARLSSALFWFNPLVWVLEREIVQQAEEAADSFASRSVDPARYAQTLVKWAQFGNHALPANSMAPATAALARRVRAILEGAPRNQQPRSAVTMAAMAVCATFATALAALELIPQRAEAAPSPEPAPVAVLAAAPAPQAPAALEAPVAPEPPAARRPRPRRVAPAPAPQAPEAPEPPAAAEAPPPPLPPQPTHHLFSKAMGATPMPHPVRVRIAELERLRPELLAAMHQAQSAGATVAVPHIRIDERRIERQVERAVLQAQRAHAHGSRSMEHGAAQMERGAERMAATALRFRNPEERERAIARARARGETLTHEQLIEAAENMEEGARGLREGARGLREAAQCRETGGRPTRS